MAKEKKYFGGKKMVLKLDKYNINEEVYYRRIDVDKIVEEKYRKITTATDGTEIRRKLFVKGDTQEKEFEYKYLKEDGSIYDGEKVTQIVNVADGSMIPIDKERFIEFVEVLDEDDENVTKYLVEDIYNVYASEDVSYLYGLAERLLAEKKVLKMKFNPEGYMTGLGFIKAVKTNEGLGLLISYCRVLLGNHVQPLRKGDGGQAVKKNKVEFIE